MTVDDAVIILGFESVEAFNQWSLSADPEEVYAYGEMILEMVSG